MIKIKKEISLTREELANEFWELEQVKFFNPLGDIIQGKRIMQYI